MMADADSLNEVNLNDPLSDRDHDPRSVASGATNTSISLLLLLLLLPLRVVEVSHTLLRTVRGFLPTENIGG